MAIGRKVGERIWVGYIQSGAKAGVKIGATESKSIE